MSSRIDEESVPGIWHAVQTMVAAVDSNCKPQDELSALMTVLLSSIRTLSHEQKMDAFEAAFMASTAFKPAGVLRSTH